MQVTLMCRRCGSEVHAEDVFCQECGLSQDRQAQEAGQISTQWSDNDWPTMDADPLDPGKQHNYSNLFGQTYDFSNYQLDLEPSRVPQDSRAARGEQVESLSFESPEQTEAALNLSREENKLHSPLFDKTQAEAQDNKLGMKGGWGMVALDNAVIVAVLVFACGLGFYAYKNHKQEEARSRLEQAKKMDAAVKTAAIKDDYKSIYRQLLPSRILGQLDASKQVLFDEAAFRLGEQELESGNPEKALEFLNQVSIESEHYVRAKAIIFEHASPAVQSRQPAVEPQAKRRAKPVSSGAVDSRQTQTELSKAPALSEEAVLTLPVLEELQGQEGSPEHDGTGAEAASSDFSQSGATKTTEAPLPKFSESEISQYNRLLGLYFNRHRNRDSKAPEAPSFKEWLKNGKAAF